MGPRAVRWAVVCALLLPACTRQPTPPPAGQVAGDRRRVLIVSVDGLRPDLLIRANAPHIRGLIRQGSYTFWCQSTNVAVTLPTHVSMMTGVPPKVHGITWNDARANDADVWPRVPTLFELAKQAGYTTALVAGKGKLDILAKPGTVDATAGVRPGMKGDAGVAASAVDLIDAHRPDVVLVHFPGPDGAGHSRGWGSPQQIAAVEGVDQGLGLVLAAWRRAAPSAPSMVILTADHGGQGRSHGQARFQARGDAGEALPVPPGPDPRSLFIPWIVCAPGVRPDHDLALHADLMVHVEDTFATAAAWLGLETPAGIKGRAIDQIYDAPPARATAVPTPESQPQEATTQPPY